MQTHKMHVQLRSYSIKKFMAHYFEINLLQTVSNYLTKICKLILIY